MNTEAKMKISYCVICGTHRKLKNHKPSYIFEKNSSFYYLQQCENEDEKIFKEKESMKLLKIIGLKENISLL